jgi:hypothetical protein
MEKKVSVFQNHTELSIRDLDYWKSVSPEERLNQVELLRIEAGKFLYKYPTRLQRIITVFQRKKTD